MLAAVVQMNSGEDKAANLAHAAELTAEAGKRSAQLIVLPEMFSCLGRPEAMVAAGESIPGKTSEFLSRIAARLKVVLVAGSIPEVSNAAGKVFNTALIFNADGSLLARYRKMHLFDVDLAEEACYHESDLECGRRQDHGREYGDRSAGSSDLLRFEVSRTFPRARTRGGGDHCDSVGIHARYGARSLGSSIARAGDRESGIRVSRESIRSARPKPDDLRSIDDRRSVGNGDRDSG